MYANIPCPKCGKEIKLKKSLLIQNFSKTVKLKCINKECGTVFKLKINKDFAAKVDLFPHLQSNTKENDKTKIEINDKTKIQQQNQVNKILSVFLLDETTGKKYQLKKGENIIGRKSYSDTKQTIPLDTNDKTISRNHIRINFIIDNSGIQLFLRDLNSVNHTYLNSEDNELSPMEEMTLVDNDVLLLGKSKFRILIE